MDGRTDRGNNKICTRTFFRKCGYKNTIINYFIYGLGNSIWLYALDLYPWKTLSIIPNVFYGIRIKLHSCTTEVLLDGAMTFQCDDDGMITMTRWNDSAISMLHWRDSVMQRWNNCAYARNVDDAMKMNRCSIPTPLSHHCTINNFTLLLFEENGGKIIV